MARIDESVLSSIVRRLVRALVRRLIIRVSENHLLPPVHIGLINAVLNARSAGLLLGGSISLCLGLDVVPTGRDTAGGSE